MVTFISCAHLLAHSMNRREGFQICPDQFFRPFNFPPAGTVDNDRCPCHASYVWSGAEVVGGGEYSFVDNSGMSVPMSIDTCQKSLKFAHSPPSRLREGVGHHH